MTDTPQGRVSDWIKDNYWWVLMGVLLMVGVGIAYAVAPGSNQGLPDAAQVISFATLAAVGIERSLEIAWTLVDQSPAGAYWPMSAVKKEMKKAEDQTNAILGSVVRDAKAALTTVRQAALQAGESVETIDRQIARLDEAFSSANTRFQQAKKLAPGSTRIANAAGAADTVSTELRSALKLVGDAGSGVAQQLDLVELRLGTALDVVASFQDNPFRRLSSLMLGAAAGAIVAGFVGLNLFAAISDAGIRELQAQLGVVVTGLVIGLGSGPTHELVKNLQANKKAGQLKPVASRGLAPLVEPTTEEVVEEAYTMELARTPGSRELLATVRAPARPAVVMEAAPRVPRRTVFIRSTD